MLATFDSLYDRGVILYITRKLPLVSWIKQWFNSFRDPKNGVFLNMFKMFKMMRWRYCRNFYGIWGLQHNWNMRNAFMFDSRHGVKAYMKMLKYILMWNFWILEHVGIIFSNAYSGFLVA